jgi:pSer/pThr/pTyr-binding forkhead associated (FHA) protein
MHTSLRIQRRKRRALRDSKTVGPCQWLTLHRISSQKRFGSHITVKYQYCASCAVFLAKLYLTCLCLNFELVYSVMAVYVPPPWSTPPKYTFALQVLKSGIEVDRIALEKASTIVGKQSGVCDIVLEHASISRQHAALQFGEEGELYCVDLGSSNGTTVNKETLESGVYKLLPVGSVVKFGASTRLFVVEGPNEFLPPETETPALAAMRASSELRQLRKVAEKHTSATEATEAPGASWGIVEQSAAEVAQGASAEARDAERAEGKIAWVETLDLTSLTEGERAVYERLHKRLLKVRNLHTESARLQKKQSAAGDEGLTPGQLAQLARDEDAITSLLPLIEEDEEQLRDRLVARGVLSSHIAGRRSAVTSFEASFLPDDDDDVTDTTAQSMLLNSSVGKAPHPRLVIRTARRLPSTSATPSIAKGRPTAGAAQVQPLPQTSLTEHGSRTRAAAQGGTAEGSAIETVATLQKSLVECRARWLELQRDSGSSSADAFQQDGADSLDAFLAATDAEVLQAERHARNQERSALETEVARLEALLAALKEVTGEAFLPAPLQQDLDAHQGTNFANADIGTQSAALQPGKRRMQEDNASAVAREPDEVHRKKPREEGGSMARTASAALQVFRHSIAEPLSRAIETRTRESTGSAPGGFDGDAPEAVWVPPSNQVGDGRTALNDILGY